MFTYMNIVIELTGLFYNKKNADFSVFYRLLVFNIKLSLNLVEVFD